MFSEAVENLQRQIKRDGQVVARLSVNRQLTRVRISYLDDDRLIISDLPPEAPPILVLRNQRVFFDEDQQSGPEPDGEAEAFTRLYRTWDPRALARGLGQEYPSPQGRWLMRFQVTEAVPSKFVYEFLRPEERVREVQFVVDEEAKTLVEFSQWDFAPNQTLLTIDFRGD